MSTVKTTNLQNPSAASPNIVLGSTGSVAVAGAMVGAGMDLITTQTFSAVSSVSLNNVFSSTYDNYRVLIQDVTTAGSPAAWNFRMRLRAAGIDVTAASHSIWGQYIATGSTAFTQLTGQTSWALNGSIGSTPSNTPFDVFNPNRAANSAISMTAQGQDQWSNVAGLLANTNQYDGFTIYPTSSTITGTIRVYGYRNA